MPEIGICHIPNHVPYHGSVQSRRNAQLPTVVQETAVIQYDKGRIHRPTVIVLGHHIGGSMGKSAESFHFSADVFLCDPSLCRGFLIQHGILHPGKGPYFLDLFKSRPVPVPDGNHNIPHIPVPFKVRLPGADVRSSDKAFHHGKGHEGENQRQGGRPQGFPLCFQGISRQFPFHAEEKRQDRGLFSAFQLQFPCISNGLKRRKPA